MRNSLSLFVSILKFSQLRFANLLDQILFEFLTDYLVTIIYTNIIFLYYLVVFHAFFSEIKWRMFLNRLRNTRKRNITCMLQSFLYLQVWYESILVLTSLILLFKNSKIESIFPFYYIWYTQVHWACYKMKKTWAW